MKGGYLDQKKTGLRRMKEVAQKAMKKSNFTADDLKGDLVAYRQKYNEGYDDPLQELENEDEEEREHVSKRLEESLKQMKLMREGKLPKKTWEQFKAELEAEE